MNARFVVDRLAQSVVVGVLALSVVATTLAAAQPSRATVTIAVFSDRYILAGRAFDDLDSLEKHITAIHAHGISLLACGPGVTRSLKAAVHRFRHVSVQMRVLETDDPECFSAVPGGTPVQVHAGLRPSGIDEEAVERYWRELMP